jgi:hypothetical protein
MIRISIPYLTRAGQESTGLAGNNGKTAINNTMPAGLITPETAREMAILSVQARRLKHERELAEKERQKREGKQPLTPLQVRIKRTEAQLDQLDELIEDCSAREYPALTQAKERLLKAWALLSGFPSPGVRKQTRQRQPLTDIQPIPVDPQPVYPTASVQPAKPLGWEYD